MLVIRVAIYKMLARLANREDPDQTASSEILGLSCLSRPFWQATAFQNFRTFTVMFHCMAFQSKPNKLLRCRCWGPVLGKTRDDVTIAVPFKIMISVLLQNNIRYGSKHWYRLYHFEFLCNCALENQMHFTNTVNPLYNDNVCSKLSLTLK